MKNIFTTMGSVIDAYRKIDDPRSRFKQLLWWAFGIIAVAALLQFSKCKSLAIMSQIIISVATSLAAACLIEIFSGIREVWIKEYTQKEFREFFGCEEDLSKGSVAIVIPRFPIKELHAIAPMAFDHDLDEGPAVKRLRETDERVLAYADVKAASDLLLAFSEVNLRHLPEVHWDNEMLAKWKNGEAAQFRTFILVGLFSNSFFAEICTQASISKLFKVEGFETRAFQLAIASRSGGIMGWHNPHKAIEGEQDFALVAKVKLNDQQTAFILGGIGARGTERIGEYLLNEWSTLYNQIDSSIQPVLSVKRHAFAMSIEIPLKSGAPQIEYVVVEKPHGER